MVNCCARRDDQMMPLVNGTPVKKSSWKGHLVSFECGGKRTPSTPFSSFIGLGVTSVATVMVSQSIFNSEWEEMPASAFFSLLGLAVVITTSLIMEAADRAQVCCKKPRLFISPALLITAALVSSCATLFIMRGHANQEVSSYSNNSKWVNQTNQEIEKNCTSMVLADPQKWTSEDCVICEEKSSWFDSSSKGPFQSYLNKDPFHNLVNKGECILSPENVEVVLVANQSLPGKNYLCGATMTYNTTSTMTTELIDRCLIEFLAEDYCYFPPLVLQGTVSSTQLSLEGFATNHLSLTSRCVPDRVRDVCEPYYFLCDTPDADALFQAFEQQFQVVMNQTLPYPANAYKVLSRTKNVGWPLTLSTATFAMLTVLYESFLVRKYHQYMQSRLIT